MAIRCTIIPPIDIPAMWADATPRASSTAKPSFAMSVSVYGASRIGSPDRSLPMLARTSGTGPSVFELRPTSRLSKTTTWKPCDTNISQNAGS